MLKLVELLSTYTLGTPDFGHSDIWHFNLALKIFLSQSLKSGFLPFWSKDIGTGFPILGEGQIGMFNLYNILAFKFLDPILAFNLGFIVIALTTFIGTYLFLRVINLSKLLSIYVALIFTLSGVFVTQTVHYNLIQAASFLPWEFYLTEKFIKTNKKRWLICLAFVFSQQIFAGFQQLTLISLLGVGIYLISKSIFKKNIFLSFPIIVAFFLGAIISLPQLLPTIELIQKSIRNSGVSVAVLANFPYMPRNLVSFLNPYFFGDPRIGTYPRFSDNWGIFWESTGYIGILPLVFAIIALIKTRKNELTKTFALILLVSLVLFLGKSTPLFFVFQIFPLSLFRVPARFLFLFVWSLTILSGIGLSQIKNKRLVYIIIFISAIDIFRFALSYHAVINAKDWLVSPPAVTTLKQDTDWFRIYTVNPYAQWTTRFLKSGWKNMDLYFDFRNSLDPNQNLYWNIAQIDYYSGIGFRRLELFNNILARGIVSNPEKENVTISSQSAKLLTFASVKYLVTPYNINGGPLLLSTTSGNPKFYIYQNPTVRPHAYLTRNYKIADSISDLETKILDTKSTSVIIEKQVSFPSDNQPENPVKIVYNSDLEVNIIATASAQSLLVLSDSYFPRWKAYLDNMETEIFPVNINQRGIVVTPGMHEIRFEYHPLQIF